MEFLPILNFSLVPTNGCIHRVEIGIRLCYRSQYTVYQYQTAGGFWRLTRVFFREEAKLHVPVAPLLRLQGPQQSFVETRECGLAAHGVLCSHTGEPVRV